MAFYPGLGAIPEEPGDVGSSGPTLPAVIGIEPAQVWVDNIESLTRWDPMDLHGQGATFVDADLVEQSARKQFEFGSGVIINLQDNNLTAGNVIDIINQVYAAANTYTISGGMLQLGGSDMGLVEPLVEATPHQDGWLMVTYTVDRLALLGEYGLVPYKWRWINSINGSALAGTSISWMYNTSTDHDESEGMTVYFDGSVNLADTTIVGQNLNLGVQDDPSPYLMADLIQSYSPGGSSSLAVTRDGTNLEFSGGPVLWKFTGANMEEMQAFRAATILDAGQLNYVDAAILVRFSPLINCADSYLDMDGAVLVGLLDVTTETDVLDKIVEVVNANFPVTAVRSGTDITYNTSSEANYPVNSSMYTGVSIVGLTTAFYNAGSGQVAAGEVANATIQNLQSISWSGNYQSAANGLTTY